MSDENTKASSPSRIYETSAEYRPEDGAAQLRNLAIIGIAASETVMNVCGKDDAMISLFEVMARLAEEVADGVAELRREASI